MHKKDFKSNILCKAHNNALSQVDQAGTKAFEALSDAAFNTARQKKNKIDGNLLERWLLKTQINMEVLADFRFRPPLDVVELAFGKRSFGGNAGLFLIDSPVRSFSPEERIRYVRCLDAVSNQVVAGRFNFGGFDLLLSIVKINTSLPLSIEDMGDVQLLHHPHRFTFDGSRFVALSWVPDD